MNQKVTVYTKAYNTRPYLKQCIDSVLSQSYSNFEYILVDNGCTDGSSQILQDYAQRDKRIELISYDQNRRINLQELIKSRGTDSSYITVLDSDDWWEPNYLEQMIGLAMDTKADIVSTGTLMHPEGGGANSARRLEHRLVLNHPQYSEWLPHYHAFFRTVWAKLIRTQLYLAADFSKSEELKNQGLLTVLIQFVLLPAFGKQNESVWIILFYIITVSTNDLFPTSMIQNAFCLMLICTTTLYDFSKILGL